MRFLPLLFVLLLCLISPTHAQPSPDEPILFYTTPSPTDAETVLLCQKNMADLEAESCLTLPHFYNYAFSPDYTLLAISATENGQVHLVNLTEQSLIALGLCTPAQDFLWDEHTQQSGTLTWSPDGRYLAFTGVDQAESCTTRDEGSIYVYDVTAESLNNFTEGLAVPNALVSPASWSPDSEWLLLYGAWVTEGEDAPQFAPAIIGRDGTGFRRIAPGWEGACRLHGSADMRWLAGQTSCTEAIATGSDFVIIPFAVNPLEGIQPETYLDARISPFRLGQRPANGWQSSYSAPLWTSPHQIVVHRSLQPLGVNIDQTQDQHARYSVSGLVSIDVETLSETLIAELSGEASQQGDWFIADTLDAVTLINGRNIQQRIVLPRTGPAPCLPFNALSISANADYLAVLNNCDIPAETLSLVILSDEGSSIIWEKAFDSLEVRLLGFSG